MQYIYGFYLYYRHTPTYKEVAHPLFVCHPLSITTFYLPFSFFCWNPNRVVRQIFWLSVTRNFHYGIFFIIVHYPTHSVLTFCLPKKLLFVYLQLPKYPFCLPSYSIIKLLYYLCIVLKVLFVYPIKNTFYLQPRIICVFVSANFKNFLSTILKLLFMYLRGLHVAYFYWRLIHIRLSNILRHLFYNCSLPHS